MTDRLTKEEREEMRERFEAATEGPWDGETYRTLAGYARHDLPRALDEIDRLEERAEELEAERNKLDDLAELDGGIVLMRELLDAFEGREGESILFDEFASQSTEMLAKCREERARVADLAPETVSRERREEVMEAWEELDELREERRKMAADMIEWAQVLAAPSELRSYEELMADYVPESQEMVEDLYEWALSVRHEEETNE